MRRLLKWTGIGCGSLVGLVIVVVIIVAIFGGGGNQSASSQHSSEVFTKANYGRLVSNPDAHRGAKVDVAGQLLASPQANGSDLDFQMFADPINSDWDTVVHIKSTNMNLKENDYVHVKGTVNGSYSGQNAFGGDVSAVEVDATDVKPVSSVEAVDPTQKSVVVGQTNSDKGFGVTIQKIDFGQKTTRVYVTAQNGTQSNVSFYDTDAKIIQGSSQSDAKLPMNYDIHEPQSELSPGVKSSGAMVFGKVDPSQPFQIRFGWSSDNYNINPKAIVFEIQP